MREFSVPWEGKELGVKLKRASEVTGGRGIGRDGACTNGDANAPPVIASVQVSWDMTSGGRHLEDLWAPVSLS